MAKFFLLADDDHDDADLFSEALTEIDVTVEFMHVADCPSLFKYLENPSNKKPDIIFLDLNMPEMNGWECIDQLKKKAEHQDIPVIIYSTSSSQRDIDNASRSQALGFITKPNNYRILVNLLGSIASVDHTEIPRVLHDHGKR
ncbi:MAG TPA: response regulator [Saprospiraceae bacterium]|nr:response regulator [Saprospiraceae bacterium]